MGDITIGDITFTMGSNASLEYFNVSASADEGSVGNVTIGDITIDAGINAIAILSTASTSGQTTTSAR